MSDPVSLSRLQQALGGFGIQVFDDETPWQCSGYPVALNLDAGRRIILDIPEPGVLSNYNPDQVGVMVVAATGKIKQRWGLATKLDAFASGKNVLDSGISSLVATAAKEGISGTMHLDGYRYFVSGSSKKGRSSDVFVLIVDARDEAVAQHNATLSMRSTEVFRRIGKALTMHQTLEELCVLAAHEIAGAAGLAAVLLWGRAGEDERLTLFGHVGVTRQGASAVQVLEPRERLTCAAEMVAGKKKALWVHSLKENSITAQLEAKFCYLPPGAMFVLPLMIGDRIIGVLELIGREGDLAFNESREMFDVIAEHLSLAINTCLAFSNLEKLATVDPMTGVSNHRALQEFLHARTSEAERTGSDIGVVMLDVDHFRTFNEEEGHDAGDYVLKKVAEVLKDTIRPYDLAARYGGEEFSVVMPGLDLEFSYEVAERIRKKIEQIEFISANGRQRYVTASLGVSSYPMTAKEPARLLKAADIALFKAKRGGRNQVIKYVGELIGEGEVEEAENNLLEKWGNPEDVAKSKVLLEKCGPFMEVLSTQLRLTRAQSLNLEQLVEVYPTYKRLMSLNNPELMRKIELAPEFRTLLPSLLTLNERYDGNGPMRIVGQKIPLLTRILSVLLAIAEESARPLLHDREKFDPEIISIIADVQHAA